MMDIIHIGLHPLWIFWHYGALMLEYLNTIIY